jgi:hypothetical protein
LFIPKWCISSDSCLIPDESWLEFLLFYAYYLKIFTEIRTDFDKFCSHFSNSGTSLTAQFSKLVIYLERLDLAIPSKTSV